MRFWLVLLVTCAASAQEGFRYNQGTRPAASEASPGRPVAPPPAEPEPKQMFENLRKAFDAAPTGALTLGEIKKYGKYFGGGLLCYKVEEPTAKFRVPGVTSTYVRDTASFSWDIGFGPTGDNDIPRAIGLGLERNYPPVERNDRSWRGQPFTLTREGDGAVYSREFGEYNGSKPPLPEPRNHLATKVTLEVRKDAKGNYLAHFHDQAAGDEPSLVTDIYCLGAPRPSDFFGK